MSNTQTPTNPPALTLEQACHLLSDANRCMLLRELSKGETLPMLEIVRRSGFPRHVIHRHLALLSKLGVVTRAYGRLYVLAPAYRPAPGVNTIDFGHFIARLDTPVS